MKMSPRKTRRGAKAEDVNKTLSETILQKYDENSPPPSQRTRRTRRQLSKSTTQDSEADQTLEINKSQRKIAQITSSAKSTRSRKKIQSENTIDDTSSILVDDTTVSKKRMKKAKSGEVSSDQTILLDGSAMNGSRIEKSRATKRHKRTGKKEDTKSDKESTELAITKGNNDLTKNSSINVYGYEDLSINEADEVPMTNEDNEVQQVSLRSLRFRTSASATSSPRVIAKRRDRGAKVKIEDFTPESSPITVNLTPHRTTKTPIKSPINLGSPKSHAEQSVGLLKTPRKLPVVEDSPAVSEASVDLSIKDTPGKSSNKQSATKTISLDTSSARKQKRTSKRKLTIKSPRKSPSKDVYVRKFSSPKIVLKTPKRKSSKKQKSPRIVMSEAKISPIHRSFTKSPTNSDKSQSSPGPRETMMIYDTMSPKSPKRTKKSQSPKKSVTNTRQLTNSWPHLNLSRIDSPNNTALLKKSRNRSPAKGVNNSITHLSPTVLVNKISIPDIVTTETTPTRISSRKRNSSIDDSLNITPVKTPNAEKRISQGAESPRRSKSAVKKRTPITDSGTPLRPIASPRVSSSGTSIEKSIIISSNKSTPTENRKTRLKNSSSVPMLSSTPRERIRRSINLSSVLNTIPPIVSSPVNESNIDSSTVNTEAYTKRSLRIEDVTNPLISEDDESFSLNEYSQNPEKSCLDETFEMAKKTMINVEEEENKAIDGTYELIEPKTPVLRKKAGKRSLAEVDSSIEERSPKRACRVRFLTPPPNLENNGKVERPMGRSRSVTPGQRFANKRTTPGTSSIAIGRTENNMRRRSNSMTNVSMIKTPISAIKRRSNSASDINNISTRKAAQNASVNRLSKPRIPIQQSNKQTEMKTPVPKKAPNFALIHERKFAKMESLVDAKKRVEKRHLAINSQIPTSMSKVNTAARSKPKVLPKSSAPNVPVNGAYNRYGFKLRKNDAVKIISQKQPIRTSEKKQNENRILLKGVRTNRRFELIMKARNQ